jgi:hypothetical protein
MRRATNVAAADRLFHMGVRGRDGCDRHAKHRRDCHHHGDYPERVWQTQICAEHTPPKISFPTEPHIVFFKTKGMWWLRKKLGSAQEFVQKVELGRLRRLAVSISSCLASGWGLNGKTGVNAFIGMAGISRIQVPGGRGSQDIEGVVRKKPIHKGLECSGCGRRVHAVVASWEREVAQSSG